jgi:hypothetical protein
VAFTGPGDATCTECGLKIYLTVKVTWASLALAQGSTARESGLVAGENAPR